MTTQFEEGSPNAKFLVLGQAPTRTEVSRKRPLVGPAGEVFDECLRMAGLSRRECYIVNLWQEPVFTDPKTGVVYDYKGGDELATKKGLTRLGWEMAEPTLELIRQSKANVILALGQQAMEATTGKPTMIMKWRGSILSGSGMVLGKKVVPTVHPAATIHGVYLWRYMIISDMIKAIEESERPELVLPRRDILIRPTLAQCLNFMREALNADELATDIEVVNHQVSCFSLCTRVDEGITVPLTDERGPYFDEDDEVLIWKAYADLMYKKELPKVNQNLMCFDAVFLMMQNRIRVRGPIGDPMLAQHILYPEFNKGLDFIASMHTREPYWKDEGKMWKNEGGDFEVFWRYCGKDSCVALEAWHVLHKELVHRDMMKTYEYTVGMMDQLLYMTLSGLKIDREELERTKLRIEQRIDEKMKELEEVADYPFNPNSSPQCKAYFYDHKGLTPYRNGAGGITTDDNAMSRIFRKTHMREAKLVQEIRALKKLKGTYLDVQTDADDRLRCSWNARGTWTGRLSSSQTILGTGTNLQNLDPMFKAFIIADTE